MAVICVVCESEINSSNYITCKTCNNKVHLICADLKRQSSRTGKTPSKPTGICKTCAKKQEESGEGGSGDGSGNEGSGSEDDVQSLKIIKAFMAEITVKLASLPEIQKSCDFISAQYDTFAENQQQQNEKINELINTVSELTLQLKQKDEIIASMSEKINDLEQNMMSRNVEIHGVPRQTNENVLALVGQLGTQLGLSPRPIASDELNNAGKAIMITPTPAACAAAAVSYTEDVYRLPYSKQGQEPVIIVKFKTLRDKQNFVREKKKVKPTVGSLLNTDSSKKIYINNQLTIINKNLLWRAKTAAKEKNYTFVWEMNGKVFARKNENSEFIRIKHEKDISKMI